MPSAELLAFNAEARGRKPLLSSAYDPIAMRAQLASTPSMAAPASGCVPLPSGASIERRGDQTSSRVLLMIAGGGFCFGPNDSHRALLDRLCAGTGAKGALVHPRLAPEHPFPAAHLDAISAIQAIQAEPGVGRIDGIADSSGAALLLSAIGQLTDGGSHGLTRCVLISAFTDLATTGLSYVANAESDPMFGPEAVIHKAWHYLQGANPTDPRASPFWGDVRGLPPLLMFVGSTETMLDDTVRFADKVAQAGGEALLRVYEDAPHDFPLIPHLPEAAAAIDEMLNFLTP